jgi:CRP-like cAMP-binding protein
MPVDAVYRIIATMTVRSFNDHDYVFSVGEKGHLMYVIISGAVRVYVGSVGSDNDAALEIARLSGMGQSFGELALYSEAPRTATCIADGKLETLVLEKGNFVKLCPPRIFADVMTFSPKSADKVVHALSEPLRKRSVLAESVIVQFLRRVKFFENLPTSTNVAL